jgi:hypothetical protein
LALLRPSGEHIPIVRAAGAPSQLTTSSSLHNYRSPHFVSRHIAQELILANAFGRETDVCTAPGRDDDLFESLFAEFRSPIATDIQTHPGEEPIRHEGMQLRIFITQNYMRLAAGVEDDDWRIKLSRMHGDHNKLFRRLFSQAERRLTHERPNRDEPSQQPQCSREYPQRNHA